jgi:hypothetical protein
LGGWAFKATFQTKDLSVEVSTADGIPGAIIWLVVLTCITIMLLAVFMAWSRFATEQRSMSKKRVIVIEGRGLRDDDGISLLEAVTKDFRGQRIPYLLDLRQRQDGRITEPEELLGKISAMTTWFHQISKNGERRDLEVVYGGLTSVPFTFLTGVLLDDESKISVMDWDRAVENWRPLDRPDDGVRFAEADLKSVEGAQEVVVAVSVSYVVKDENIATTFTGPIIKLELEDIGSSHWSAKKQAALAEQFLFLAKKLDALGVKRIHLILAAPNSVVFNIGRRYDKRNLPAITVYQFEASQEIRYPWGVAMPVVGLGAARLIQTGNR